MSRCRLAIHATDLGVRWLMSVTLLVLLFAGCGTPDPLAFAPASPSSHPDASRRGPFPVGVRTVVFEDLARPKHDGSPRRVVTELWYPATQDTRGKPGTSYDISEVFTQAQQVQIAAGGGLPLLQTDAVRDAPPAKAHGPFPLVLFSHGQGAVRYQSTYYTVQLASHGYIVISPDHEGDTLKEAVRNTMDDVVTSTFARMADVTFLLDTLLSLAPADPLAGLVDPLHIGVTGHSFGALTALRSGVTDPRIKAIVPQAPPGLDFSWLGLKPPVSLKIPVLLQAAHDDRTLPWDQHVAPSWPRLSHPRYLLDLSHGGHFTFSDLCALNLASLADSIKLDVPGADIKNVLNDGCGPTATPLLVAWPLIDRFAIGFFNAYLRGDERAKAELTQATADALFAGAAVLTADP